MDFVRVGAVLVHARRDGNRSAPTLVMSNTLGADLRLWERVVAYLEERCFVIRYDQRGHGLSDLGAGGASLDDLTDDLAGLLDQLDTGPSTICGLGLGGLTALMLSQRRPELVSGLCLLGTVEDRAASVDAQAKLRRSRSEGLDGIADDVMRTWFAEPFRDQRADEVRGWRMMLTRTPRAAYDVGLHALAGARVDDAVAAVRVPTLCMLGSAEPGARRRQAHSLVRNIGGVSVEEIAGAAHLSPVSHPGPIAAALLALLDACRQR